MFVQSILFLLALALPNAVSQKAAFAGTFSGGSEGGLEGTVMVQDANTLVIKNYVLADANAPALYWWGATDNDLSSGFRISETQVTETAEGGELQISLDSGKTVADFSTVGLWCERYGVNFGQATLQPSSENSDTNPPSGGSGPTTTPSGGSAITTTLSGANGPTTTSSEGNGASESPSTAASKSSATRPILPDQYTTARVYFFSVLGLLFLESIMHFPLYLITIFKRDRSYIQSPSRHSKIYLFVHKLFSLPSPIPFLTTMTLLDLLRLATFVGLNILWGWNRFKYSSDYELYGQLTLANGGLVLLLGARSNLFAIVARIPSPTLLMYHRWIGRATVIHATIHFSALVRSYTTSGQLSTVVQTLRIQVGLMAWSSLALIAITSISFIRRRWFESFYYLHALFLLFVVGALIHATHAAEFIVPGLAHWIIDRLIRFAYNFRRIEMVSITQYAGELTKFKVRGVRSHSPGQIAWIQIPGASLVNWHPFTIVSSPSNAEHVTFAVRGLGNYTKKVQTLAAAAEEAQEIKQTERAGPGPRVLAPPKMRVDGPYGVGRTQWGIHTVTVIVAGGIGITPGISIANHIIERATRLGQRKTGLRWNLHIVWVIKAPQYMAWFEEELSHLIAVAADPFVPASLDLRIHVTDDKATSLEVDESASELSQPSEHHNYLDPRKLIHHGRPDLRSYFQALRNQYPGLDAVVSACGPRSLIDSVRREAVAGQNHGSNMGAYYVEEEVFEL